MRSHQPTRQPAANPQRKLGIMPTSSLTLLLFVLFISSARAQPRVEEERPLARAVREASALLDAGDHAHAVVTLEAALDSVAPAEHIADALALLARANFAAGHYRPALDVSRSFARAYPTDPRVDDVTYIRAVSAHEEGSLPEAMTSFHRVASSTSPHRAHANYWLARMHGDLFRPFVGIPQS
jgi:outer membrane protein assembly factor BamD (BamD/ComL family)